MTIFNIKFKKDEIAIFQDGEEIASTEDYKEVLAYIAHIVKTERIKEYKVYSVDERGNREKVDLDVEEIVSKEKELKKYKFDNDDNDKFEDPRFNRNRNEEDFNPRNFENRKFRDREPEEIRPRRFIYTPTSTMHDFQELGNTFAKSMKSLGNSK